MNQVITISCPSAGVLLLKKTDPAFTFFRPTILTYKASPAPSVVVGVVDPARMEVQLINFMQHMAENDTFLSLPGINLVWGGGGGACPHPYSYTCMMLVLRRGGGGGILSLALLIHPCHTLLMHVTTLPCLLIQSLASCPNSCASHRPNPVPPEGVAPALVVERQNLTWRL